MPIIILLDLSISMAQSIFKINTADINIEDTTTTTSNNTITNKRFLDYFRSTIQYLIEGTKEKTSDYMLDPIALITYSSEVNVQLPFSRDFGNFLEEFINLDIRLSDKSNLINALESTVEIIQNQFGNSSGISNEIFIFTDQCTSFDDNNSSNKIYNDIKSFEFPFIHQFHFISICINQDHHYHNHNYLTTLSNQIDDNYIANKLQKDKHQKLFKNNNYNAIINDYFKGTIDIIKISNDLVNTNNNNINHNCSRLKSELSNIMDKIINTTFTIYKSVLAFGRLSTPLSFYPSPITLLNFLNNNEFDNNNNLITVLNNNINNSNNNSNLNTSSNNNSNINNNNNKNLLPSYKTLMSLSIIGFLPNKSIYSTPTLSRFLIIPLVSDASNGNGLPPLCSVLLNILKSENVTALVYIQEGWYGMIIPTFDCDVPILSLCVFEPDIDLPFTTNELDSFEIGNLNDFFQHQLQHIQQLQQQQQQQYGGSLIQSKPPPLQPFSEPQSIYPLSYNSIADFNNINFIKNDTIQNEFTKISRLFKSLPQKLESLIIECEKIRVLSLLYQPNLTKALLALLMDEFKSIKNPDDKTYHYVNELILFLENPIEPINANSLTQSLAIKQQQHQQQQKNYQQQQSQQQSQQQRSKKSKQSLFNNILNN